MRDAVRREGQVDTSRVGLDRVVALDVLENDPAEHEVGGTELLPWIVGVSRKDVLQTLRSAVGYEVLEHGSRHVHRNHTRKVCRHGDCQATNTASDVHGT